MRCSCCRTTIQFLLVQAPRNDVIALFDDGEELYFLGANAFIDQHPWMRDVRVVIVTDTAVGGPIHLNQTGPRNGWLIEALARAYTGGVWASSTGGTGTFEHTPFRAAGIQGLELEDNYAFRQQHTALDRVEIVSPASMQQLGEQVLSITRELSDRDLGTPWDESQAIFSVAPLAFVHYPLAWTAPLAFISVALLLLSVGIALRCRIATWRGLALGILAILASATVGGLWARVPTEFGWSTTRRGPK